MNLVLRNIAMLDEAREIKPDFEEAELTLKEENQNSQDAYFAMLLENLQKLRAGNTTNLSITNTTQSIVNQILHQVNHYRYNFSGLDLSKAHKINQSVQSLLSKKENISNDLLDRNIEQLQKLLGQKEIIKKNAKVFELNKYIKGGYETGKDHNGLFLSLYEENKPILFLSGNKKFIKANAFLLSKKLEEPNFVLDSTKMVAVEEKKLLQKQVDKNIQQETDKNIPRVDYSKVWKLGQLKIYRINQKNVYQETNANIQGLNNQNSYLVNNNNVHQIINQNLHPLTHNNYPQVADQNFYQVANNNRQKVADKNIQKLSDKSFFKVASKSKHHVVDRNNHQVVDKNLYQVEDKNLPQTENDIVFKEEQQNQYHITKIIRNQSEKPSEIRDINQTKTHSRTSSGISFKIEHERLRSFTKLIWNDTTYRSDTIHIERENIPSNKENKNETKQSFDSKNQEKRFQSKIEKLLEAQKIISEKEKKKQALFDSQPSNSLYKGQIRFAKEKATFFFQKDLVLPSIAFLHAKQTKRQSFVDVNLIDIGTNLEKFVYFDKSSTRFTKERFANLTGANPKKTGTSLANLEFVSQTSESIKKTIHSHANVSFTNQISEDTKNTQKTLENVEFVDRAGVNTKKLVSSLANNDLPDQTNANQKKTVLGLVSSTFFNRINTKLESLAFVHRMDLFQDPYEKLTFTTKEKNKNRYPTRQSKDIQTLEFDKNVFYRVQNEILVSRENVEKEEFLTLVKHSLSAEELSKFVKTQVEIIMRSQTDSVEDITTQNTRQEQLKESKSSLERRSDFKNWESLETPLDDTLQIKIKNILKTKEFQDIISETNRIKREELFTTLVEQISRQVINRFEQWYRTQQRIYGR